MTELKLKRTIEAYAGALGAALAPSGRVEVREPTGPGVGGGWWRDGRLVPDRWITDAAHRAKIRAQARRSIARHLVLARDLIARGAYA